MSRKVRGTPRAWREDRHGREEISGEGEARKEDESRRANFEYHLPLVAKVGLYDFLRRSRTEVLDPDTLKRR